MRTIARNLSPTQTFGLTLMRLKHAAALEAIATANSAIKSVCIWHGSLRSVGSLKRFRSLKTLLVASWPGELDVVAELPNLRSLRIVHLPKVTTLLPLANLRQLELLCLETLPSWDGSGRRTRLDGLRSLTKLNQLRDVCFRGKITTKDGRIDWLAKCPSLETIAAGSGFEANSIAALRKMRPQTRIE